MSLEVYIQPKLAIRISAVDSASCNPTCPYCRTADFSGFDCTLFMKNLRMDNAEISESSVLTRGFKAVEIRRCEECVKSEVKRD